jgi:hypothetical protein
MDQVGALELIGEEADVLLRAPLDVVETKNNLTPKGRN